MQQEATIGRLNMAAGAAEAVVKIEVAEGRIDVVAVEAAEHLVPRPTHSGFPAAPLSRR